MDKSKMLRVVVAVAYVGMVLVGVGGAYDTWTSDKVSVGIAISVTGAVLAVLAWIGGGCLGLYEDR